MKYIHDTVKEQIKAIKKIVKNQLKTPNADLSSQSPHTYTCACTHAHLHVHCVYIQKNDTHYIHILWNTVRVGKLGFTILIIKL